jgi:2-polyprenyl-3-methyl-5-hydroxy-6-metoxy-1,4-benzoquinol methylase
MKENFSPVVTDVLEWIARELPKELRHDSFARNYYKHCHNIEDGLKNVGGGKGNILDIGSGIGVFAAAMAYLGHTVVSADVNADNHGWINGHGVKTVSCNILDQPLPFADASFDLVTMFDVIEHLHGSPSHALAEVRRVLRPGGSLIVETPNVVNLRRRLVMLLGKNPASVKYFYDSSLPYSGHVYEYTKEDLERVLLWSGFQLVESKRLNVARRHHATSEGYAEGLTLSGVDGVVMLGYLALSSVVSGFRDTLVCIARR